MSRKSTGKKMRFEIFKRDNFTCQYCGQKPPAVVLRCDHILPVSKGGGNEPTNLLTSCFDCNAGKSDNELGDTITPLSTAMDKEREKFEQLKEYQGFLEERAQSVEEWFTRVSDAWIILEGNDPNKWRKAGDDAKVIRQFLKLLPAEEIIDALRIAFYKFPPPYTDYKRRKYICGICWRKINEAKEGVHA